MSASTRIFLAVTALIVVVLVLYYGVFSGESAPQTARATDDPTQPHKPEQSIDRRQANDAPLRVEPPQPEPRRLSSPQPTPPAAPVETTEEPTITHDPLAATPPVEDLAPVDLRASDETAGGKDGAVTVPDAVEDAESDIGTGEDVAESEAEPQPDSEPQPEPDPAPAPVPVPAPAPGAPQYTQYTVKANETMSSIAAEWFGDAGKWDLIAKANPLVDPARLSVGQVLRLPPKDTKRDDPEEKAGDKPIEYTVRSGDTLSKIARMYYGHERHWQRIYDANKSVIGDSPNNLKVGMKLTIPPVPSE